MPCENLAFMHSREMRQRALSQVATGRSLNAVARELGISRAAIREWQDRGVDPPPATGCPRMGGPPPAAEYAALLGFYLGDGCISPLARTYSLRVVCDDRYPGIISDVGSLILAVRGRGPVGRVAAPGCTVVSGYWNHWPCVFPQHGPGRKHERRLVLGPWQQEIVDRHPAAFVRGLFHSDGCRVTNWTTRPVAGQIKRYEYGRWHFTNHSLDIQGFLIDALDLLEIPWRQSSWKMLSVSRREAVARLDELIGPKS